MDKDKAAYIWVVHDDGEIIGSFTFPEAARDFAREQTIKLFKRVACYESFDYRFIITEDQGQEIDKRYPFFSLKRMAFESITTLTDLDIAAILLGIEAGGYCIMKTRLYC